MNKVYLARVQTGDMIKNVTVISEDGREAVERELKKTFGGRLLAFSVQHSDPKIPRSSDASLQARPG